MKDHQPFEIPEQGREHVKSVFFVFLVVFSGTFVYEFVKQALHPNITIWESHLITIIFSAVVSSMVAFVLLQRYQKLKRQIIERVAERDKAEEKLRLLSIVFKDATDPILIEDLTGKIINLNAETEHVYGWTRQELLNQPIKILVPPAYHQQADELLARCRGGEKVRNVEGVRWSKSGQAQPVLLTLSLLTDISGKPIGIATIAKEISELKETEQALRQSQSELEQRVEDRTAELSTANARLEEENAHRQRAESQLRDTLAEVKQTRDDLMSILDGLHSGTVMTDEEERVIFVSESAKRLLQLQGEMEIGKPWEECFPIAERDKMELQTLAGLPPDQRRKLTVQGSPSPNHHPLSLEVQVNDDPRNPRRKIFFLYDRSEVHDLRRLLEDKVQFHDLVGKSKPMALVYQQIRQVATVDTTVLIEGETGTGKELVARAIHFSSHRKDQPFIPVNSAGLTESLLGSQLFGHKRGAFTGAVSDHKGVFEEANGGTLFLDEIGDIPLSMQTSLLRVLQEKEIIRLGESKPRKIDVRVLAATHRDLNDAVAQGAFRADLLYRIRVARVHLPALSKRQEDIPLLAGTFLNLSRRMMQKEVDCISPTAMRKLLSYSWPGNVRELKSAIEFAVISCTSSSIEPYDLPPEILPTNEAPLDFQGFPDEKARLLAALDSVNGNRVEAAKLLGISRATLFRRLSDFGLTRQK